MFHMYDMRPKQPLAPIFVNLDEDLVLTYKVGPLGKTVPTSVGGLIKLAASRG